MAPDLVAGERARVFWTGGWDSTFRLLQALFIENRTVEPHYLVDPGRESTLHEVRAMHAIRAAVAERLDEPARLLPTRMMMRTEVPPVDALRQTYGRIREQVRIGSQYLWLAEYCHLRNLHGVELCMEHAEPPAALQHFLFADRATVPPRFHDRPETALFGRFRFPTLHLTKQAMREMASHHGLLDILERSWFCHRPVLGKPCGSCWPCRMAQRAGQEVEYVPFRRVFFALHVAKTRWRKLRGRTRSRW